MTGMRQNELLLTSASFKAQGLLVFQSVFIFHTFHISNNLLEGSCICRSLLFVKTIGENIERRRKCFFSFLF